jgi:hypothetical protein
MNPTGAIGGVNKRAPAEGSPLLGGQSDGILPLPLWIELFNRCAYGNDALYLAIKSDVAIRDAELKRLRWEWILWRGESLATSPCQRRGVEEMERNDTNEFHPGLGAS